MTTSIPDSSTQYRREGRALCARRGSRPVRALAAAVLGAAATLIAAPANAADPTRPLQGSCTTTFAFNATGAIDIAGTCRYAHLGLTTTSATQIVVFHPDGSSDITNTTVYTAANGDKLFATVVGAGQATSLTTIVFSGVETYDGGTGRFLNASGSSLIEGAAEFSGVGATTGTGHFTTTGHIAY